MSVEPGRGGGPLKPDGRVDSVDVARGVALIGMAAFHLTWDLADFRLISPLLPFTPPMRLLSHTVASAFLALAGLSLALAHRDRVNLKAFGKRLAIVGGAAALVTAGSAAFAPGMAIWFGILHCIAAASLIALPLIEAPAWASLARRRRGDRAAVPRSVDGVRLRRRCSGSGLAWRCRTRSTGARSSRGRASPCSASAPHGCPGSSHG